MSASVFFKRHYLQTALCCYKVSGLLCHDERVTVVLIRWGCRVCYQGTLIPCKYICWQWDWRVVLC